MAAADGSKSSNVRRKSLKTSAVGRKGFPRKASELSKEELLLTLQKKKECNALALKIVECLLEPKVNETWFLGVLQHINQSHLQDVIEERAILKLCGYPLCGNILKNVPTQQYCISTRNNKVYDITERKLFCSNLCFGACRFIKDQMHTSPLWLRDIEPKVCFKLMPISEYSCAGDEVDVAPERITGEESHWTRKEISDSKERPLISSNKLSAVQPSSSGRNDNISAIIFNTENVHLSQSEISSSVSLNCSKPTEAVLLNLKQDHEEKQEDVLQSNNEDNNPGVSFEEASVSNVEMKLSESPQETSPSVHFENISKVMSQIEELKFESSSENTSQFKIKPKNEMSTSNDNEISVESNLSVRQVLSSTLGSNGKAISKPIAKMLTNNAEMAMRVTTFVGRECLEPEKALQQLPCDKVNHSASTISVLEPDRKCTVLDSNSSVKKIREKSKEPSEVKFQKKEGRTSAINILPLISNVEKSLQEWFTLETMYFLYGENALRTMFKENGEKIMNHCKALNFATWDSEKHERFIAICKRLNLMELEDTNFDNKIRKEEAERQRRPLPDYSVLKEEAKIMELKVRAFYGGKMEVNEKKVTFAEDFKSETEEMEQTDKTPQVPLLHLHSQRALRKKIVLDGLNRVLPDFFRTFGLRSSEMASSVRGLVGTFSLSPCNITFKPQEWTLVGLIIVKLLSLREPILKARLESEQSHTYLTLMLMSLKLEAGYLDRLLIWLTDIDQLLLKQEGSP